MTDEELIARLRDGCNLQQRDGERAADRIEALTKEQDELQVVVDKQGALLADAYGADLDWEEVLKQRADHEALRQIKALTDKLAKAVEALEECMEEIDAYIRQEYPHDHPVQERYRQRDYAANPARLALAEIKGESHD